MDQKNFVLALVLSVAIIVGWQYAFPPPKPTTPTTTPTEQQAGPPGAPTTPAAPAAPTGQPGAPTAPAGTQAAVSRDEALKRTPRVTFSTPELLG
ncbi:MAG TPA: membrane protein insertase YidC, partial [Reyranellaceae bacterium]|nr:membrane protein insertase YidC [Reyranellaceae bacterium]